MTYERPAHARRLGDASILIVLFFVVTRAMLAELAGLLQRIANMSKVNQVCTCAVSWILFLVWFGLAWLNPHPSFCPVRRR